jgi:hypothetical protein
MDVRAMPLGAWVESSFRFAVSQIAAGRLGSTTVIAKLSELLFVEAVSHYIAGLPEDRKGWLAGVNRSADWARVGVDACAAGEGLECGGDCANQEKRWRRWGTALDMSRRRHFGRSTGSLGWDRRVAAVSRTLNAACRPRAQPVGDAGMSGL